MLWKSSWPPKAQPAIIMTIRHEIVEFLPYSPLSFLTS